MATDEQVDVMTDAEFKSFIQTDEGKDWNRQWVQWINSSSESGAGGFFKLAPNAGKLVCSYGDLTGLDNRGFTNVWNVGPHTEQVKFLDRKRRLSGREWSV